MRKAILLMLCWALLALAADVSGAWKFTVETDQGTGNPTFVLKQSGEALSGTYTGMLGKAEVKGTVKGERIEIELTPEIDGQKITVKYSGTITSGTRMQGTVDFAGMGSGKWTAAKE